MRIFVMHKNRGIENEVVVENETHLPDLRKTFWNLVSYLPSDERT